MPVPYYGDFAEDATVYIPVNTFDSNDPTASVTVTNLLNTDVHIHKDGNTTQRNNAAGITMTIDYDSITGNHLLIIDTSDDTVGGFWTAGSEYQVRIEGATVDAGTINAWVGAFSIERAGGALALLKNGTYGLSALDTELGTLATAAKLLKYIQLLARSDAAIAADNATELTAINADGGSGAGDYSNQTEANEAIRDHIGDGTNLTEAGGDGDHLTEAGGDGDHLTEAGGDGDHLTAINLPNQTMDITGDITGNLSGSVGSVTTVSDKTGYALSAAGNTAVIDEFETQSQADPTGFHVNVMEVNGTAQTANDNGADINDILTDTGTTIPGLIAALNDLAAADVWDLASALTLDFGTLLERSYELLNNELDITDATGAAALRNIGDTANIATWGITDDDTTTIKTEATWS